MRHSGEVEYREYLPTPALRPFVARYWELEGAGGEAERVLPDGRPEFVVHLAEPFENQARCLFIGQQYRAVNLRPSGRVHVFGVRLHPAGAAAFLREPMAEWAGQIVPLNDVWSREAAMWEASLHDAATSFDRRALTDRFLLQRLHGKERPIHLGSAIDAVLRDPFARIESIAEQAGRSRRQLEREFLHAVGLPPKTWARIVRLQRALAVRRESPERSWARIATECGYYDQAHLIGDCRRITGQAPIGRESAETAMERMLVANFQDNPAPQPLGSLA